MIVEELVGSFVALVSSLIIQTPPMARENLQREYTLITEGSQTDEVCDDLIHCEYEQGAPTEVPSYEEDLSVLLQDDQQRRRNFCESFIRSFKANVGLLMAVVFILGLLIVGLVYVDLNTTNSCVAWIHHNFSVPSNVRIIRIAGMCAALVPLFAWFPGCLVMLWGLKEFKKNFLMCLICQLVALTLDCVYTIVFLDKKTAAANNVQYRLPGDIIFVISIVCCGILVARKFKKVNLETSCSVYRIFFILSFAFLGSCLLAYIYVYVIITYFTKTEDRIKKAIIAALTPGMTIPVTAIAKYLVLRKSSEIVTPDRAFVLCYFIRGGSIVLYRTMQSGFQSIWLFIGLSLLHGVSNVLSKATLNIRIKMWTFFVECYNKTCCGPRLEVQPLNTPRIRRFNADLEIQNILFEYSTVILSQAYLACYLVTNFDVPPWQVINGSLIRIAISLAIDFVFNLISVFIQIHFYDIPMRKVWLKFWRRHVIANAFMIIIFISYFDESLVSVFTDHNYVATEHKPRNCTSTF